VAKVLVLLLVTMYRMYSMLSTTLKLSSLLASCWQTYREVQINSHGAMKTLRARRRSMFSYWSGNWESLLRSMAKDE